MEEPSAFAKFVLVVLWIAGMVALSWALHHYVQRSWFEGWPVWLDVIVATVGIGGGIWATCDEWHRRLRVRRERRGLTD